MILTEATEGHDRKLVQGQKLGRVISLEFQKLENSVMADLELESERMGRIPQGIEIPPEWAMDLGHSARPVIELYHTQEVAKSAARIGVSVFELSNPKIQFAIDKLTFDFARSTWRKTSKDLNQVVDRLKTELLEGSLAGDPIPELTRRVETLFDRAKKWEARRIAVSESARATHSAQVAVAKESGFVIGKRWLLSRNACEICQGIARQSGVVPLDAPFAYRGSGPYAEILYPPAHPNCQCTIIEVFDQLADVPPQPKW